MGAAALSRILSHLRGCTETKPGTQWQAKCPVHKDGNEEHPSLGVSIDASGRILVNCLCGCNKSDIVSCWGMTVADLAPDGEARPRLHDPERKVPPEEWEARAAGWAAFLAKSSGARAWIARSLLLPESVLDQFPGAGYWNDRKPVDAWTFPERDAKGRIVGISLRTKDGEKRVVKDSDRGLSIPLGWKERPGPLYLPEGVSDVLALTAAGMAAVGRPAVNIKIELLAEFVRDQVPADRRVVWLGENDRKPDGSWPGRDASRKAAKRLAGLIGRDIEFSLPPGDEKDSRAWLTKLVDDGVQWEHAADRFEKGLRPEKVVAPKGPKPGDRVRIILNTNNEKLINNKVIAAISDDPGLFVRGATIVGITNEGTQEQRGCQFPPGPQIEAVEAYTLRECISDHVDFRRVDKNEDHVETHPPEWCVGAVLKRKSWPKMRYLEAVVEYPVVRPDGSLIAEAGYDEKTGVFYNPSGDAPVIPDRIDRDAAMQAWETLRDLISEFPFKDNGVHMSAWLCALLTPLARFAFRGAAPLFLVDANTPGTGKGLLCDTISIPLTGQEFATTHYSQDDEEMRKNITTLVLAGARMVFLDNIAGTFGGSALDKVLTSTIWQDRLLGGNKSVSLPMRVTWFGTGNNVQIAGDLLRRVCHIRLETDQEKPEERTGFKNPRLRRWMKAERRNLLGCALTILMAYHKAGKPQHPKMSEWGGYEEWSETVRGCAMWLGLPDPAEGKKNMTKDADPSVAAMQLLLDEWHKLDAPIGGITANQIISKVFPREQRLIDHELNDIADAISSITTRQTGQHLSTQFRKFRKRVLGKWKLDRVTTSGNVIRWGRFSPNGANLSNAKPGSEGGDHSEDTSGSAGKKDAPANSGEEKIIQLRETDPHHPHHPHSSEGDDGGENPFSKYDA